MLNSMKQLRNAPSQWDSLCLISPRRIEDLAAEGQAMDMAAVVADTGVQVIVDLLHGTEVPAMVLCAIVKDMGLAMAVGAIRTGRCQERKLINLRRPSV